MELKNNKYHRIFLLIAFSLSFNACVEPIEMETENFVSALVVEATITNEVKHQEISLSRTYPIEQEDGPPPESNAVVSVVDDTQQEYSFFESAPGVYMSVEEFGAQPGRSYQLIISTSDGNTIQSEPTEMAPSAPIEDVVPVPATNSVGDPGIALVLEGATSQSGASFYRYEFEETFKIVSPYKKKQDLIVENGELKLVPKIKEEYICYRTQVSEEIILANTSVLSEDKVDGLSVRFIENGSPIMSHRYSILVKQYGLSPEAYSYYQTLEELSESENLFSQIQPGYLPGNMHALDDPEEKVLGYFNVSEVTTERTFFSFEDFFGEEDDRPSYVGYCPAITGLSQERLIQGILAGTLKFFSRIFPGVYAMVRAQCVDCTIFGSNVVPEFWIEE